ncbi:MAG: hypothetical protein ACLVLD_30140, partial [Hungatella sp.]|uniref:hypothetical protein n=1 Tax=Hungatella sp. TaxID=2613924 RepID=UPI00399AD9FE
RKPAAKRPSLRLMRSFLKISIRNSRGERGQGGRGQNFYAQHFIEFRNIPHVLKSISGTKWENMILARSGDITAQ